MGGSKGQAPLKIRKIHIHRTKKKLFVFSNTMKALEIIACVLSFGHFFSSDDVVFCKFKMGNFVFSLAKILTILANL